MAELDAKLVDRAVAEATKRAANLDYFFDNLSSPDWIEPLRDRGLFAEPPAQIVDERGYIRAPGWSASRYLARVAAKAPEKVASAVRGIHTDNERVHEDFVAAALAMPREQARAVALDEADWIASRDYLYYLLPRKVVELVTQLVQSNEIEAAIGLVHALFAPSLVARDAGMGLKRPQARFSDWEYDQLLTKIAESVVPAAPAEMLRELVALLGRALDVMRKDEDDDEGFDAVSRIWRVRIEDDRDRATQLEETLVSAVRDAALLIRARRLLKDHEVVEELTTRREELLRRIAMHALTKEPEPDLELVRRFIVDPDALADGEPSVEYRELLVANASRLSANDVEALLTVVREGPDVDGFKERSKGFGGREVTDQEVEHYVAWWRAGRLKLLLPALDDKELKEYESLVALVGDAELPTSGEVRTFVGPTSPVTAQELATMSDDELLDFLRSWEPEPRWDGPSVEGLARTLAEFTQQHPDRIGALTSGLRHLRPAYVQWALEGLESALREGKRFSWEPVIELLRWVVEQPREIPEGRRDDYSDLDPGWVWTRREIASLLERGLGLHDERAIPASQREDVWSVISAIANDPDPTPEHEDRYGGSNMDPATLALNTARPRAIRAAVAYAVWLYRILEMDRSKADEGDAALFREAPEVARLLEQHLDATVDPSASVRAAIGQFYANLFVVDTRWAASRARLVFPENDSLLREAAWGAYIIYTPPYNNVLSNLRRVYHRSAELAGESGHGFAWMNGDPRSKLGEHLATFYWRGIIALDDPLLTTFWDRAPSEARRHVIDFLGRSARDLPELEPQVEERLLAFWGFVRDKAERSDAEAELAPFAWWFAAAVLPRPWRIEQLTELLRRKIKPDPAFLVAEALPAIASEEPLRTVQALRRLLELQSESWTFDAWKDEIEQVLRVAASSEDRDAQVIAEETAHWLGALGYRDFRALVN